MPESKGRPQKVKASRESRAASAKLAPSPRWYAPVMVGLMLLGLVWIVTFYLSGAQYPVSAWGNWNLAAGFALIIAGFMMTTNWR